MRSTLSCLQNLHVGTIQQYFNSSLSTQSFLILSDTMPITNHNPRGLSFNIANEAQETVPITKTVNYDSCYLSLLKITRQWLIRSFMPRMNHRYSRKSSPPRLSRLSDDVSKIRCHNKVDGDVSCLLKLCPLVKVSKNPFESDFTRLSVVDHT